MGHSRLPRAPCRVHFKLDRDTNSAITRAKHFTCTYLVNLIHTITRISCVVPLTGCSFPPWPQPRPSTDRGKRIGHHIRPPRIPAPIGAAEKRKERKKSLTRGHVEDIGSTLDIQSYEEHGSEGVLFGKCIATSRRLHLYVMAILSGALVVRVL